MHGVFEKNSIPPKQVPSAVNFLFLKRSCAMSNFGYDDYKCAKHMLMHLHSLDEFSLTFRRPPDGHLELAQPTVSPFTEGATAVRADREGAPLCRRP